MEPLLSEMDKLIRAVLDALPAPILLVDDDLRILGYNQAGAQLLSEPSSPVLRQRAGEVLHCIHSTEPPEDCGHAPACQDCVIRNAVGEALRGQRVVRKRAHLQWQRGDEFEPVFMLITTAPLAYQDQVLVVLTLEDITELIELRGLLPICSNCKRIRSDASYWQKVEHYFEERLDVAFTHGICPDCARELYPKAYER